MYWDSELADALDTINCSEQYIVIDSCFSGGIIDEISAPGRFILTASSETEMSLESPDLKHGVFSNYFLEACLNNATDTNFNGNISLEEVYAYAYSEVVSYSTSLGYVHHPQYYDGITGETVILVDGDGEWLPDDEEEEDGGIGVSTLSIIVASLGGVSLLLIKFRKNK